MLQSTQSEDKRTYPTTTTSHSQNYYSALDVDESETRKSKGKVAATRQYSPHDSRIPVLHALSVPHQDILAWFGKVESYFYASGICENSQKYLITAGSLTSQVQEEVEDILTFPPKTHAYECLLISLFRRNMSAVKKCQREPIGFHKLVQQLPFELRVKFELHCSETMAISSCLCL